MTVKIQSSSLSLSLSLSLIQPLGVPATMFEDLPANSTGHFESELPAAKGRRNSVQSARGESARTRDRRNDRRRWREATGTRSYAKRETGSDRAVQLAGSNDPSKVIREPIRYDTMVELVFEEISISTFFFNFNNPLNP